MAAFFCCKSSPSVIYCDRDSCVNCCDDVVYNRGWILLVGHDAHRRLLKAEAIFFSFECSTRTRAPAASNQYNTHLIFSDSFSLEDAEILALKTLKQVNGHHQLCNGQGITTISI